MSIKARKGTNAHSSQDPRGSYDNDLKSYCQKARAGSHVHWPGVLLGHGDKGNSYSETDLQTLKGNGWLRVSREKSRCLNPLLQRWLKFSRVCEIKTLPWIEQHLRHAGRGWQQRERSGGQCMRGSVWHRAHLSHYRMLTPYASEFV